MFPRAAGVSGVLSYDIALIDNLRLGNFNRNGYLGWPLWAGLMLDYVLASAA